MTVQALSKYLKTLKRQTELELTKTEVKIAQIEENIAYYERMLALIDPDGSVSKDGDLKTIVSSADSQRLSLEHCRTPKKMKRPQYAGFTLVESIQKVLDNNQDPMLVNQIVESIFDVRSKKEFLRAKNALYVELRSNSRGSAKKWKKISKYLYASLLFKAE